MGRDEFDRLRGKPPTERAANWLQCDYYAFLVHPRLRPHDPVGEQAMFETIERMRLKLQHLAVLDGLTRVRQEELAALVVEFLALREMYENYRRSLRWVGYRQLLGKREWRKFKKATETLETLAKRLSSGELGRHRRAIEEGLIKPNSDRDPNPWANRLKGIVADLMMIRSELETKADVKTYREWMRNHYPSAIDSKVDASKQLYWFLVSKCRLAKNEAQNRVAKIGNGLLGQDVKYREKYEGDELWKGSPAIRQRLGRDRGRKRRSEPKSKAKSTERALIENPAESRDQS